MKNLLKIFMITITLLIFSISYIYAIDMFLTNQDATNTNNEKEINDNIIKVENELHEENYVEEEIITTRK